MGLGVIIKPSSFIIIIVDIVIHLQRNPSDNDG